MTFWREVRCGGGDDTGGVLTIPVRSRGTKEILSPGFPEWTRWRQEMFREKRESICTFVG